MAQLEVQQLETRVPKIKIWELNELEDKMFLIGAPGIGKSVRVYELAKREAEELGKIFVDIREDILEKKNYRLLADIVKNPDKYYLYYRMIAPHVHPEDINIPLPPEITAQRFGEMYKELGVIFEVPLALKLLTLCREEGGETRCVYGTLFIDELTNVETRAQYSMYYSIIQEKEIGFSNRLSPNIKVVVAGNPKRYSSAVALDIPEPLINRMKILYVDEPDSIEDVRNWIEWMNEKEAENPERYAWLKEVGVFLTLNPGYLFSPEEFDRSRYLSETLGIPINFPSPRSWTALARILKKHEDLIKQLREGKASEDSEAARIIRALIIGSIGLSVGEMFYEFLKYKPMNTLEFITGGYKKRMEKAKTGGTKELMNFLVDFYSATRDVVLAGTPLSSLDPNKVVKGKTVIQHFINVYKTLLREPMLRELGNVAILAIFDACTEARKRGYGKQALQNAYNIFVGVDRSLIDKVVQFFKERR